MPDRHASSGRVTGASLLSKAASVSTTKSPALATCSWTSSHFNADDASISSPRRTTSTAAASDSGSVSCQSMLKRVPVSSRSAAAMMSSATWGSSHSALLITGLVRPMPGATLRCHRRSTRASSRAHNVAASALTRSWSRSAPAAVCACSYASSAASSLAVVLRRSVSRASNRASASTWADSASSARITCWARSFRTVSRSSDKVPMRSMAAPSAWP
ncbi:unannotated protein [freshwater metagenome]|uniref:Unannotated protein n=1 Tax=freshwater metagenome TaxID=449393 RepID=A0A6J7ITK6_9ZZZZ